MKTFKNAKLAIDKIIRCQQIEITTIENCLMKKLSGIEVDQLIAMRNSALKIIEEHEKLRKELIQGQEIILMLG